MSERVFANGWTREALRERIIQRSKELNRPTEDTFRALRAMNQMSDEKLGEIVQQIASELGLDRD